jgi:hypothetical protein
MATLRWDDFQRVRERPLRVAFRAERLTGPDLQPPGPHLHVGHHRRTQVAEPVRIAWGAGGSAPHNETVTGLEVAHTRGARDSCSPARRRDHQDLDVLAPTDESSVESPVHPHAELVPHSCQSVLEGAHRRVSNETASERRRIQPRTRTTRLRRRRFRIRGRWIGLRRRGPRI